MDVYDFRVLVIKPNNTIFRVEFIEICTSQGVSKERERESLYVCVSVYFLMPVVPSAFLSPAFSVFSF